MDERKMTLKQLMDAIQAIDAILPGIKKHFKLAYKLSQAKRRLSPDVNDYQKAREEIIKSKGVPVVRCSSQEQLSGEGIALVQENGPGFIYDIDESIFDEFKATHPSVVEMDRGFFRFINSDDRKEVQKAIDELLSTEVDLVPPIPLSLFDGVEVDGLGGHIERLGDLLIDDTEQA